MGRYDAEVRKRGEATGLDTLVASRKRESANAVGRPAVVAPSVKHSAWGDGRKA